MTVNPTFDGRIRGTPMTRREPPRGYIMSSGRRGANSTSKGPMSSRVNFLYNPSEISVHHSVNVDSGILPADIDSDFDVTQTMGKSGGSISFRLLFDRTYETTDPTSKSPAAYSGVYADVSALYDLTGINDTRTNSLSTGSTSYDPEASSAPPLWQEQPDFGTSQVLTGTYRGVMTIRPVYVVFSEQWAIDIPNAPGRVRPLSWYGYIANLNVTYSHWTERMVPQRCGVDVQMELLVEYSGAA